MTIPANSLGLFRCPDCGKVHRDGQCERQQKNTEDNFKKEVLKQLNRIIYLLELGLGVGEKHDTL